MTTTPEQRIDIITRWSTWFYENTESWNIDDLGSTLAYLFSAIAKDKYIEIRPDHPLMNLLTGRVELISQPPGPIDEIMAFIILDGKKVPRTTLVNIVAIIPAEKGFPEVTLYQARLAGVTLNEGIKAAVRDLHDNSPDRWDDLMRKTDGFLNWGDLHLHFPREMLTKHGVEFIDMPVPELVAVDHDQDMRFGTSWPRFSSPQPPESPATPSKTCQFCGRDLDGGPCTSDDCPGNQKEVCWLCHNPIDMKKQSSYYMSKTEGQETYCHTRCGDLIHDFLDIGALEDKIEGLESQVTHLEHEIAKLKR